MARTSAAGLEDFFERAPVFFGDKDPLLPVLKADGFSPSGELNCAILPHAAITAGQDRDEAQQAGAEN